MAEYASKVHCGGRKLQMGALWELVGKVIFSLFDLKNHFSVFKSPINIAGDRLDILFHFPNDWYNNIGG